MGRTSSPTIRALQARLADRVHHLPVPRVQNVLMATTDRNLALALLEGGGYSRLSLLEELEAATLIPGELERIRRSRWPWQGILADPAIVYAGARKAATAGVPACDQGGRG